MRDAGINNMKPITIQFVIEKLVDEINKLICGGNELDIDEDEIEEINEAIATLGIDASIIPF